MSQRCVEGRLPLIPLLDSDQVIGIAKIQLGKHGGFVERLECRVNEGERVFVLDGYIVQAPVVNAWPEYLVFLENKEKTCPTGEEDG